MGQIPSADYEPFIVDLETVKISERLAAVPLSVETFGDIDSPLFQQFYRARCDDLVRHWYCSSPERETIHEPPTPETVYRKFIEEASAYIETDPADLTPMPIVLLKLHEPWSTRTVVPTMADLRDGQGCEVVGYFGCRHFNADGSADDYGVLGLFLTKAFHNEAKSVAILEIACKCYTHFSLQVGCRQPAWPREIRFGTLDANLPCLRLMQKLLSSMGPTFMEAWQNEIRFEHDETDHRVRCTIRGGAIRSCAEALSSHVDEKFTLRTKSVDPAPCSVVHPILDAAVIYAKSKWAESNRIVHELHKSQSSSSVSSASQPAVSEPSTPVTSTRSSISPAPAPASPVYTNDPYGTRWVQPVVGTIAATESCAPARFHAPARPQQQQQSQAISQADKPVILYLPKRTALSFWKRGAWLNAQWRSEERPLRLAPVQHALDSGLLCVEAVNDNELDVAIFDEWSRPARLRLEQAAFYVPVQSAYLMESESKSFYPFMMDPHYQAMVTAAQPRSLYASRR